MRRFIWRSWTSTWRRTPSRFVRTLGNRRTDDGPSSSSREPCTRRPAFQRSPNIKVVYINEHASTAQIVPALAPHLFPDNFNRRIESARAYRPSGVLRAGQTIAGAVTSDIGKGGLACER